MAKNIFDKARQLAAQLKGTVQNTFRPPVHSPVPQYNAQPTYNRTLNQARINVMKPLAAVQRGIQSPQPTRIVPDIRPAGNKTLLGKAVNTVTSIGSNIANDFIRQPIDIGLDTGKIIAGGVRGKLPAYTQLKSAPYRLAYNAKGIQRTPQQVIGNIAGTAAIPLTYTLPKGMANAGRQALQTGIKQPLLRATLQGARQGAIDAGSYGALEGLSQNREKSLVQQFLQAGKQGGESAIAGGVFGGAVSGAGSMAGRVRDIVAGNYLKINPKATIEEAKQQASKFIRDEMGRFAKGGSRKEPVFYGDLRKSLGLPEDYRGGFIDLDAEVNVKPNKLDGILNKKARIKEEISKLGKQSDLTETGRFNTEKINKLNQLKHDLTQLTVSEAELKKKSKNFTPLTPEQQAVKAKLPSIMYSTSKKVAEGKTPQSVGEVLKSTDDYVKDLVGRQKNAKVMDPSGAKPKGKLGTFFSEIKEKFVDTTSPIEDAVTSAEKQGKFKVLPKEDVRLQIDRVLRSKTLASQFAEDNGMVDVIRNAPDLDYLDQYMIAKQARDVGEQGIQTGRNSAQDEQLIRELGPQYEQFASKVNDYSRKLLKYSVDTGLIDKDLATELVKKYPNYVPINRIFSDLEKGALPKVGGKAVASISKQSVVQKLQGSEREIASPIESLLLKTQDAFNQGERNKAARMLAQMKDIPYFKNLIRELPEGQDAAHKFSYLDNGKKRSFETTKDIEAAAKSLTVESMGLIGKVFSIPTRLLQLGATGLNLPFVITNVVKDQMTTFVNSNKAARTSLLNPLNFTRSFFAAIGHDDLYKEVVRQGAGGTSFDISREAPDLAVKRIRAGRNTGSKIAYSVTHPGELLRAVEDIVGRGEELTRIQNYRGTKNALLGEGRTLQDAQLLGAQAGRENTANFARKGSLGKVINLVIPFFNAGIQGARQLDRSFMKDPAGTTFKIGVGLFTPMAMATTWNLSDPARKQVYEDIDDFEKENNIIIIPDGATQDEKGRWNVIKIPIPPGLSNLTTLVRRPFEQASGLDPVRFSEIATNLFTAGTSMDVTNPNKLLNTALPQAVKPFIETQTNTNLFTGNKIVPDSMKDLPPELQVRDTTSPGAKFIGNKLGISPLKVENFVTTAAGGLGSQLIGKEDPASNLQRRFSKASGGKQTDKQFEEIQRLKTESATENYKKKKVLNTIVTAPVEKRKALVIEAIKNNQITKKELIERIKEESQNLQPIEKSIKTLPIQKKAEYVLGQTKGMSDKDKKAFIMDYYKRKIISKDALIEIIKQDTQVGGKSTGDTQTTTREKDGFPFPDYSESVPGQRLRADLNLKGTGNADIVFHMRTPEGKVIDMPQSTEKLSNTSQPYGLEFLVPRDISPGTAEVWVTINGKEVLGTRKKHTIKSGNPVERYQSWKQ